MKLPITLFVLLPALAFADAGPTPLGPNNGKFGDWDRRQLRQRRRQSLLRLHDSASVRPRHRRGVAR